MGMIRRADLEQLTRDALVMNLDDLRSRADAIVEDARLQADRLRADAHAEHERLIASAHGQGFNEGHTEGLALGKKEGAEIGSAQARDAEAESLGVLLEGWSGALGGFEEQREQLMREARTDVIKLAAEIARRVVRRAVDIDPRVVEAQMDAVLGAIARPTRLVVRVHPDDMNCAERALPAMLGRFELCKHAELVADAAIGRGSVVASTEGGGRIDASIQAQLDRIIVELLPEDQALLGDPEQGADDGENADPRSDAA